MKKIVVCVVLFLLAWSGVMGQPGVGEEMKDWEYGLRVYMLDPIKDEPCLLLGSPSSSITATGLNYSNSNYHIDGFFRMTDISSLRITSSFNFTQTSCYTYRGSLTYTAPTNALQGFIGNTINTDGLPGLNKTGQWNYGSLFISITPPRPNTLNVQMKNAVGTSYDNYYYIVAGINIKLAAGFKSYYSSATYYYKLNNSSTWNKVEGEFHTFTEDELNGANSVLIRAYGSAVSSGAGGGLLDKAPKVIERGITPNPGGGENVMYSPGYIEQTYTIVRFPKVTITEKTRDCNNNKSTYNIVTDTWPNEISAIEVAREGSYVSLTKLNSVGSIDVNFGQTYSISYFGSSSGNSGSSELYFKNEKNEFEKPDVAYTGIKDLFCAPTSSVELKFSQPSGFTYKYAATTGGIPLETEWRDNISVANPQAIHPWVKATQIVNNIGLDCIIKNNDINVEDHRYKSVTVDATNITCKGASDGLINASLLFNNQLDLGVYQGRIEKVGNEKVGNLSEKNGVMLKWLSYAGLNADTYKVIIETTSGQQCLSVEKTIHESPTLLSIQSVTPTFVVNYGESSAQIGYTFTGGTGPYTVRLLRSDNSLFGSTTINGLSGVFTSVPAGTYNLQVTDLYGCFKEQQNVVVSGPQDRLTLSVSNVVQPKCFGDNSGSITIVASNGWGAPYQYSINGGSYGVASTFSSLIDGTYNLSVKDCKGGQTSIIKILQQPIALTVTPTVKNVANLNSSTGIVYYSISGGTTTPSGYQILLQKNGTSVIYNRSLVQAPFSGFIDGLPSGTYTLTVTDVNGCKWTKSDIAILEPPSGLSISASVTDAKCNGGKDGSVILTASGGWNSKYQYSKNGSDYVDGATFSGLAFGSYSFSVKDANDGIFNITKVDVKQPNALTVTPTVKNVANLNSSTGIVYYSISGGTTTPSGYQIILQKKWNICYL